MKMNKFVKNIKQSDIYKEYLNSLNGILRLTPRELDILAKIVEYNPNATDQTEFANVVSLQIRRKLIKELRVNKSNLSKFISNFIDKKILIKDSITGGVHINKALSPIIDNDTVTIQMIIKLNDDKNN